MCVDFHYTHITALPMKSSILRHFSRHSSSKPFYCTTPIFYVNASPHLGHLYSMLLADTRVRWEKLKKGQKSYFLTGTDEHGLKIQGVAEKQNVEPKALVDSVSQNFKHMARKMKIDYLRFIRTTDDDHVEAVKHFWNVMMQKGLIYKGIHDGWYSVSDEAFYTEAQIEEVSDGSGGARRVSKETGSEVVYQEEENYFFRLSAFQDRLIQYIEENPTLIQPQHKMKQVLEELKSEPLKDLSVSRHTSRLQWGIEVPNDPTQKVYVWFDALLNYLTAAGYPHRDLKAPYNIWPACHVLGKDIMRFHCIYWPIFLMAAEIDLPKMIFVHSHWLCDGKKMSKSIGNVVDPYLMADYYGVDPLRFFLMEQSNINTDSNFSEDALFNHRGMLLNKFANLTSRVCAPKFEIAEGLRQANTGVFNDIDSLLLADTVTSTDKKRTIELRNELVVAIDSLKEEMDAPLQQFDHMKALKLWWNVVELINGFFQATEPWAYNKFAEAEKERAIRNYLVYVATEGIRVTTLCIQPYMPDLSAAILDRLAVSKDKRALDYAKLGGDPDYGKGSNRQHKDKLMQKIEPRTENL